MSERCRFCMCKIESGYHEQDCPVRTQHEKDKPPVPTDQEIYVQGQLDQYKHEVTELRAALLAAWKTCPAGTPVVVTLDNGSLLETETRSFAWALGDGSPVVLLKGKAGGYALERVRRTDLVASRR